VKTVRMLAHLARADLLERIRRYSFLLVLASAVFAGYLFVPPLDAGYRVLQVGTQRGIYDSAWIGLMFGLIAALHLPLVGFYLVKNAVERDRRTGVGQIIATTPTSKLIYVAGKWLSNLAVLALILSVMTVMAVVMQLIRAEDTTVRLGAMVSTIWLMGLPVLSIAAALAILFECAPLLRGGFGNVVFFFLWLFALIVVLAGSIDEETDLVQSGSDLYSFSRSIASIQQQVLSDDPDAQVGSGLVIIEREIESTFVWNGLSWKMGIIVERMMWAGLALIIALAASIPFDRFDPARRRLRPKRTGLCSRLQRRLEAMRRGGILRRETAETVAAPKVTAGSLTPVDASARRGRFLGVFAAELKLMLKGQSLLWYAGALGLNLGCLLNPSDNLQRYLLLAVWLWPLALWSQMGARERRFNTAQVVFSVPRSALRQLPAMWLAGVVVAVVAGSGAWLYLALTGETVSLLSWFVGALFVPALALALGVWVGNSRAFETVYLLWWYIGLMEGVPALDYAGTTARGLAMGMPFVYLGIAAALLVLALLGRWRQIPGGGLTITTSCKAAYAVAAVVGALLVSGVLLSIAFTATLSPQSSRADVVNGWAVLAEKNDYGDIDILGDLPVDFINTSRLRQMLEDVGWAPDHIRELRDFDRETLADGLDWLAANADEDDIVFVYVGAHGGFYLPEETVGLDPMSRIRTDMAKWDEFFPVEWKQIPSHRRLLVTDSCFAARYTSAISDEPSPYISVAAVAGDEGIWWGLEEEGLPIIGSVFTHYFAAAFANPEADTDADGLISVQEAASLAEAQQRAYMHDVVLAVPRFVESFHRVGVSPEKDPAYPHVVVDDAIGKPLYLALDAYP
jgi:hypothetical protein